MTDCAHWYVLGDPAGGRVSGRCKHCDAVKDWKSTYDPLQSFNLYLSRDPLLPRVEGAFGLPSYY